MKHTIYQMNKDDLQTFIDIIETARIVYTERGDAQGIQVTTALLDRLALGEPPIFAPRSQQA